MVIGDESAALAATSTSSFFMGYLILQELAVYIWPVLPIVLLSPHNLTRRLAG